MKKVNYGVVTEIPVEAITLSEFNPRKFFDGASLTELGHSLSDKGTIHPVIVEATADGKYELFIGGRRLRAAVQLKLEKVPAFVVSGVEDHEKLLMALTENLHREDLTPFEEAWAFLKLINEFKMSMKDLAGEIDREEQYVRRRIQLLSLPEPVQELLAKRSLSMTHVDALMKLDSPKDQIQFAEAATADKLSGSDLAVLVEKELGLNGKRGSRPKHHRSRWGAELGGKRLALKILKMVGWLKVMAPGVSTMSKPEQEQVFQALDKLVAAAGDFVSRAQKKKTRR